MYADWLGLPRERFICQLWAQYTPAVSPALTPFTGRDYVCVVGGEGRDYSTLVAAARRGACRTSSSHAATTSSGRCPRTSSCSTTCPAR